MSFHILHASVASIRPAIWRRLCIPHGMTMGQLHQALQLAFGWRDAHVHEFNVHTDRFGIPAIDEPHDEDMWDENGLIVPNVLSREGDEFQYSYDFHGDDWIVHGKVECIEWDPLSGKPPPSPAPRPDVIVCLDGARAGPPDDCGGPLGYARLLRELANPSHRHHQEAIDWIGEDFDPESFSRTALNLQLAVMSERTSNISS